MSEKREKISSILLQIPGKKPISFELFPAEAWDHPDAAPGLFRVRAGGVWYQEPGRRYSFLTLAAVGAMLTREAARGMGERRTGPGPRPDLKRGSRVRWRPYDDKPMQCLFTASVPFVGINGRWQIFITGENEPVFCDELEKL